MSQVFFTSDLHLGHKKIPELSHRPFKDIEEHDFAIYKTWFKTVGDDDIVWVLGDLSIEGSWKHALDIMRQLPGRKRLITGNHDQVWVGKSDSFRFLKEYLKVFEVVTPWARATVMGKKVLLSHFPYFGDHTNEDRFDSYRLRWSETPLIHGHVHSTTRRTLTTKNGQALDWIAEAYFNNDELIRKSVGSVYNPATVQVHVGVDAHDYQLVSAKTVYDLLTV